jgi:predicted small lipoprotein YifL
MKTISAKTTGRLAVSAGLLALSLLAGCGNKGPLVKPSDIPPPDTMPAPAMPATDATPTPAVPTPAASADGTG